MDDILDNTWRIVELIDERTGEVSIGIGFPTTLQNTGFISLDSDLRENAAKVRLALKRRGAMLVGNNIEKQTEVIRGLLKGLSQSPRLQIPSKPGFRKDGFVLGSCMLGTAQGRYQWPNLRDSIGLSGGTKSDWDVTVGAIAKSSRYLTVAILHGLAACVPGYYKSLQKPPPISEPFTLNFSGQSGTGRTSISQAAAGLAGAPSPLGKWDFSRRGLEERCEARNDLLLVLDDTEKCDHDRLKSAIRLVTQIIPDGTSKILSGIGGLADLQFSTFGLSSSPEPLDDLATANGWKRSQGEQARLIDVAVPNRDHAGIFDLLTGSPVERIEEGKRLIAELQKGLTANFGVVFPEWLKLLLAQDHTPAIDRLIGHFVSKCASNSDGWVTRFAQKWGLLYAVGVLACQGNVLPWDRKEVARGVAHCFRKSLNAVQAESEQAREKLKLMASMAGEAARFPTSSPQNLVKFGPDALGVKATLKGKPVYGIRAASLQAFAGSKAVAKAMIDYLVQTKSIIGSQGHAKTMQLPIRLLVAGQEITKPRFYVISPTTFSRLRQQTSSASK